MYIVIIGSGRIGSTTARKLGDNGHDVVIIDSSVENLENTGGSFNGQKIKGIEFDNDTLIEAGIEKADVFLALTPDDNKNIVACRIAKDIFSVKKVIARVSNANIENMYKALGIETVNPISLAVSTIENKIF
ncbi:potassium channel family protein [Clostridium lundense]|uniref:potassium channel family protein n=1 Tax=Clostridium lundense TaxID=319475 RepID=UPI0004897CB0|nr:NAD-binding protein [Clostridium lundense]